MHSEVDRSARWFRGARFTTIVLVILALLVVAGIVAQLGIHQVGATARQVAHTNRVLRALESLHTALLDAEVAQRGYRLSGDPVFRDACRTAIPRAETAARELRSLTAEDAGQPERLAELATLLDRRLTILRDAIEANGGGVLPAAQRPLQDEGKRNLEELNTLLAAVRDNELSRLASESQRSERAGWWLSVSTAIASLLAVIGGVAAVVLVHWVTARRLQAESALRAREEADRRGEEDALRRSHGELELALVQSEDARRRAQKLEAVGRLAGGIAHDFNNLLTVINGCCDAMLLRMPPGDPARELLDAVQQAGHRAASLTRQLLAFGRRQILRPRVLDLNHVIADLSKLLSRLIGADITVELSLDSAPALVRGDLSQLEQIVMNLALNARDAMPRGGRLTIATSGITLDAAFAATHGVVQPGPFVLLTVRDTGTGIADEARPHLFEPFFTTKELGKGTGLGLATVYAIVQEAGGVIDITSASGQGATVSIYLPRADAETQVQVSPSRPPLPASTGETILVAEDEPHVRRLVGDVLRGHGYTVLQAADGVDAMRVAAAHVAPIDLLVTDVVMPHLSGHALVEHLLALRPGMKVLYLSANPSDAVERHGIPETAALLAKPFTPDTVLRQVRKTLDGS